MQKLKLNVRQIKALQEKHGIPNLLNPGQEHAPKIVQVDFLAEFYYEGSRSWENPPDREAVEEIDARELVEAFEGYMNPKKGGEGNG